MRAVIVSDFGEVNGGAAKVAITSARGLADAGIDVTFAFATGSMSPLLDHPRIDARRLDLASVWDIPNRGKAAIQGIWNSRASAALEPILCPLDRKNTLVHFHQWTKAFSPSVLAVPMRYGLPAAVSLHDYFFVCPNGAYYRYPEQKPCRSTPLSLSCIAALCDRHSGLHKAVRVLRQFATAAVTRRAGATLSIISVSAFAEQAIGKFLLPAHRRYIVRSPVSALKAEPADVAGNNAFLFAGRLTEEKGVLLAARAANTAKLPMTFAGDGPLFDRLRVMGGDIRCTGWRNESELLAELRGTRALVFPSLWYETGGLVVLEALAQGVPVIVSRATAAADYVSDGVNGYIVDAGDEHQLVSRMQALSDESLAARMGRAAHDLYWRDPPTVEAHTRDLMAVYEKILAAPGGDSLAL